MSYLDRILQHDERVIAIGRMHWIVYLRGIALVAIALLLWFLPVADGIVQFSVRGVAALAAFYGILNFIAVWIEAWTTEIAVTNKRVIHKRGLIRRETGEMNMEKVESVVVDQSIPGRIFGYGSIMVRGTGAGIEGLHHIADPLRLRSAIVVG